MQVLHTLPFDSDRKRMSVVVRECAGQKRVILLTKGADANILPIVDKSFLETEAGENTLFMAQKHLTDYAKEGLRTLCLGRKFWEECHYEAWKIMHEEAELDVYHRENLVLDSTLRAEKDIELLGNRFAGNNKYPFRSNSDRRSIAGWSSGVHSLVAKSRNQSLGSDRGQD